MPMCNLTEYSKNYSKTSGTLWGYSKDVSIDPITNSKFFKYKTSITGKQLMMEIQKKSIFFLFH